MKATKAWAVVNREGIVKAFSYAGQLLIVRHKCKAIRELTLYSGERLVHVEIREVKRPE